MVYEFCKEFLLNYFSFIQIQAKCNTFTHFKEPEYITVTKTMGM